MVSTATGTAGYRLDGDFVPRGAYFAQSLRIWAIARCDADPIGTLGQSTLLLIAEAVAFAPAIANVGKRGSHLRRSLHAGLLC
jgi:hypothetical protein